MTVILDDVAAPEDENVCHFKKCGASIGEAEMTPQGRLW